MLNRGVGAKQALTGLQGMLHMSWQSLLHSPPLPCSAVQPLLLWCVHGQQQVVGAQPVALGVSIAEDACKHQHGNT